MKRANPCQPRLKICRNFLQDLIVIIAIITVQANIAAAQQMVLPEEDQVSVHNENSQAAPTIPAQSQPGAPVPASALTIPAGTKLPLGLVRPISVTKSKPGDSVYMQITFPITVDSQMLVPPGTYLQGVIGKILKRDRTRALLSFQLSSASLIFSTGYTVISREPLTRCQQQQSRGRLIFQTQKVDPRWRCRSRGPPHRPRFQLRRWAMDHGTRSLSRVLLRQQSLRS